jgi:diacylglycerol kinase (ATP)
VLAIVATLRAHRCVAVEIEIGATRFVGPIAAAVVANGAHYGGGMKIAPGASPTDGELDLVVLGDFGRLELLRWLPTVYGGTHVRSRKVTLARGRRVRIVSASPLPTHLDGEPGSDTPVTLDVCPRALRLRV